MNQDPTTESRPGYKKNEAGIEVYDARAHIARAFEGLDAGKFLTASEIDQAGRLASNPKLHTIYLRIRSTLQGMIEGRYTKIDGVIPTYDSDGRLGAYKGIGTSTPPAPEREPQAVNDPTIECCGRDAADCDCHPLVMMYVEAKKANGERADDIEELAREVAIDLMVTSGISTELLDVAGEPAGDTVQSLLMVAFLRMPQVARTLEKILNKHNGLVTPTSHTKS